MASMLFDGGWSRRNFIAASGAAALAACSKSGPGANDTLLAGDQRGFCKIVLGASGNLATPYHIEWSSFPNAAPLLEALNAGAIDTGIGGDAAFVFAIGANARIKAIGAQKATGRGPLLVVRGNSSIRTLADLAGKTITTPRGSVSHNFVLAALEANKIPYNAVKFVFLSPQDGQAALESGAVDGWSIWDPNATLAAERGARIIGEPGLVPSYSLMFGSDIAIATKRPLLSDYRRRLYAGWAWARDNRESYAQLLAAETRIPLDIWNRMTAASHSNPVPVDARLIADEQAIADRYFRAGVIDKKIDVAKGFDSSFNV